MSTARPAAAAAAWVAVNAEAACAELPSALPPLNPNQPNHSNPAPRSVSTMLFGCVTVFG